MGILYNPDDLLVFGSRPHMRFIFASINRWIAHATVVSLHIDLGPNTATLADLGSFLHLFPQLQILLYA